MPLAMVLILALGTMTYLVVNVMMQRWLDQASDINRRFDKATASIILERENELTRKVKLIADKEEVKQAIIAKDRDRLLKIITTSKLEEEIDVLQVVDQNRVVLFSTNEPTRFEEELPENNPAILGLRELNGSFIENVGDKVALKAYAHVSIETGDSIGVVIGSMFLDDAWTLEMKNIITADIVLYDERGVIASSFPERGIISPPQAEVVENLLHGTKEQILDKNFFGEFYYNDLPYELGFYPFALRYIPKSTIYYSLAFPIPEIFAARKEILINFVFVSAAAFFLILAVGYLIIAYRITRPIKKLMQSIDLVAAGNLDTKIEKMSQDEIGNLASSFNKMVVHLKISKERDNVNAKIKSEFVTIAAHQLRTPLSAFKWMLDLLINGDFGKLNPAQKSTLEKGIMSTERMINLVGDLLDISRIEEGKYGYAFQDRSVVDILDRIIPRYAEEAKIKSITFSYKKPAKDFLSIRMDEEKLSIALQNIIENALNYTRSGGNIEISLESRAGNVLIKVKDTGIGIPSNQRDRLFTKFYRGENAVRMQTSGSGLGLYLVKNIITQHKGKIQIISKENKGTTVIVSLPALKNFLKTKEK